MHGERLAPISDPVAFAKFVADLWEQRLPDASIVRVGRTGQAQGGIDVLVRTKTRRAVGIQCKATLKLTRSTLKAEVDKALAAGTRLDEFVLATSGPHDAEMVRAAHELSDLHAADGRFCVTVYGWEELQRMAEPYPALIARDLPASDQEQFLARDPDYSAKFFLVGVSDLGSDLGRRYARPAGLAAIARHVHEFDVPLAALKQDRSASIYDWQVEAA